MNRRPLKTQFRLAFIIILSSIVATVITYALAVLLFIHTENKLVYPANYYEKRLPDIEAYILQEKTSLLGPSARAALEAKIPDEGILYEVVDSEVKRLYGTLESVDVTAKEELVTRLNTTTTGTKGNYIRTVPVLGAQGTLEGAVFLSYSLSPTYVKDTGNWWLTLLFIGALFSPFIYILIFTLLFSRMFTDNINQPLQMLIEAAGKIKEKDLDFEITYRSDNELGRLCSAFTEMKDELSRSLSAQWRMEQERVEMVEALAHDLKAPLSIIRGYTEALMDSGTPDSGKLERYLAVIHDNAEKSSKLVHQLQYTSDLEKPGSTLNLDTFELFPFLEAKVEVYELKAKQRGLDMLFYRERADLVTLYSEAEKLERILDNIVMNSMEYTPEGGRITLSVNVRNSRVQYIITDTGPGFSSRDLEKAAQRFYRGDEARGSKEGHSGLGLYIATQLAAKLGGWLKIGNSPGGGASVVFEHDGVISTRR